MNNYLGLKLIILRSQRMNRMLTKITWTIITAKRFVIFINLFSVIINLVF